jgi:hypothetical protein
MDPDTDPPAGSDRLLAVDRGDAVEGLDRAIRSDWVRR